MKVKIIADSSCDIWELPGHDFVTAPLTMSTKERSYRDDENMDVHDMLEYLAKYKDRSYSACPSITEWLTAFGDADEIYVATMTSALSGTYNSACQAKEVYLEQHPDAKILVVDSKSTSGDLLLLVEKMRKLKEEGKTFEEVCQIMEDYQKHTRLFFAFQSMHNLAQNGRLPKVVEKAIGILGLSVLGTASEAGEVKPTNKARGQKNVVKTMFEMMTEAGYNGGRLNIMHVENPVLAMELATAVKEKFPAADVNMYPTRGLVAYYAEKGGIVIGCECEKEFSL